jgi:hypothetical protein
MRKAEKISPTELPLGFEYDEGQAEEQITALAGVPMLVQTFRSLAVGRSVKQHLPLKQRQSGFDEAA